MSIPGNSRICGTADVLPDAVAVAGFATSHPVPVSSCTETAQITVTGPSGEVEHSASAAVGLVTVAFTPPEPGRYLISVVGERSKTIRGVVAARGLPFTPVRRTYVDRMDTCARGPYVTSTGLTLCADSNSEVFVYGFDGTVLETFAGASLEVLGNDVWTVLWDGTASYVEHRTATTTGLRYDGRGTEPVELDHDSLVKPGSLVKFHSDGGVIETFVDGGALISERRLKLIPPPFTGRVLVDDPGQSLFDGQACQWRAGCVSRPDCPPVQQCPEVRMNITSVRPEAVYQVTSFHESRGERVVSNLAVIAAPRPLAIDPLVTQAFILASISTSTITLRESRIVSRGLELPAFATDTHLFIPLLTDGGIDLRAVAAKGAPLTVTDDFVVLGETPFTLLIGPTPR